MFFIYDLNDGTVFHSLVFPFNAHDLAFFLKGIEYAFKPFFTYNVPLKIDGAMNNFVKKFFFSKEFQGSNCQNECPVQVIK